MIFPFRYSKKQLARPKGIFFIYCGMQILWISYTQPSKMYIEAVVLLYNGRENGTIYSLFCHYPRFRPMILCTNLITAQPFPSIREAKNAHQLKMYSTHTGLPVIATHAINQIRFETVLFPLANRRTHTSEIYVLVS